MIASQSISLSTKIANYFETSYLRCYIGDDITGVAIGGAVKNIIAIAAGILLDSNSGIMHAQLSFTWTC